MSDSRVLDVLTRRLAALRCERVFDRGALAVVPLTAATVDPNHRCEPDYVTLDEALEQELAIVEELEAGPRVARCRVRSSSDRSLLVLEGEIVRGAMQDRVINASMLLEPRCDSEIPVTCVEQGRWRRTSGSFRKGEHMTGSIRARLKRSVTDSLRGGRGPTSDQVALWREIGNLLDVSAVSSPTGSLSRALEKRCGDIESLLHDLGSVPDATGIAIVGRGRLLAMEVFDRPSTLARMAPRILRGVVLEAVAGARGERSPVFPEPESVVRDMLERLRTAIPPQATIHRSAGLAQSVRIDGSGLLAAALVHRNAVVHLGAQDA